MEMGILGLAASGKTTLFNLLTGSVQTTGAAAARATHVGVAHVPDGRLVRLSELFAPKKTTPATVRYVDVPGMETEQRREQALNLPELRTMDALTLVVRDFEREDVPHPAGSVDPVRDVRTIEEEFILSDQIVVERRLERLDRDLAKRKDPELEAERTLLRRCRAVLEEGRPLRAEELTPEESKRLRGFTFLSAKPLLVVVNRAEDAPPSDPAAEPRFAELAARPRVHLTGASATLELELSQLDAEEEQAFMAELGLADRALDRIIRASYDLLGLISFFTVGEDECRAWSIPAGTPAVEAAGAIHSDIQRGFIRAEVVRWDELLDAGALAACRQRGSLRLEGKDYRVADGDVVHFRFNV